MALDKFEAANSESIYSIRTFEDKYLVEIIAGVLSRDALHYCSDECMFKRENGTIPYDRFIDNRETS